MVAFATAVHIFTLNMTYDVPVKLFSFHLILMSLVLLAPEASRLANVVVFDRAAAPSAQPALFRRRPLVLVALALQLGYGRSRPGRLLRRAPGLVSAAAAARRNRRSTASGTSRP